MNRRVYAVLFLLCFTSGAMLAEEKATKVVDEQLLIVPAQPARSLLMRTMSDGAVSITLDERFEHKLVARVNEAGEIELTCTDDHDFAQMLLANRPGVDTILRVRNVRGAERRRAERE